MIANLTAIAPTQATYMVAVRGEPGRPRQRRRTSTSAAGQVLPNLVVVQLDTAAGSSDGVMNLFNAAGTVNAVIDIEGWFQ